jgi:uncharacterized repeat protein (TIGR02543 family)
MKVSKQMIKVFFILVCMALVCLPIQVFAIGGSDVEPMSLGELDEVYLAGPFGAGSDNNTGESPDQAVKSFEKAKELLAKDGIIYITDTYYLLQNENWSLPADVYGDAMVKRYESFTGPMIYLAYSGDAYTLTLNDIIIDGGSEDGVTANSPVIKIEYSNLILNENAIIQNNYNDDTSYLGGGAIFASNNQGPISTITVNQGAVIQNCSVTTYGGAFSLGNGAKLIINDGEIKNNSAKLIGGGVYMYGSPYGSSHKPEIEMKSGVIANNICNIDSLYMYYGGGIYNIEGIIKLSDDPVIANNIADNQISNICMANEEIINIVDQGLSEGANIGVQVNSNSNNIAVTGSNAEDYSRFFTSDDSSYIVLNGQDNVVYLHKHQFDQEIAEAEYLKAEATCTEPAVYYKSCACGEKGEETFTFGSAKGHSFTNQPSEVIATEANCEQPAAYYVKCDNCDEVSDNLTVSVGTATGHNWDKKWTIRGEYHWHECLNTNCPITNDANKDGYGTHNLELDDGDCTTAVYCADCGVTMIEAQANHNWSQQPSFDDEYHWYECQNENCMQKNEMAEHEYDNAADADCNLCDYVRTVSEYMIQFDAAGGKVDTHTLVTEGGKIQNLPKATRSGYSFLGWFTEQTGGIKITSDTSFNKGTTVYAHWSKTSPTVNQTTVVEPTQNGKVILEDKSPTTGDNVNFEVKPDFGYKVDKVIVTDNYGNKLDIAENDDGTYSFVMPSSKVNIKVEFIRFQSADNCELGQTCPMYPFNDLDVSKWYHDGVHYCLENGLMAGTSEKEFDPNGITTRGMIATIIYRLEGTPETLNNDVFTDVGQDTYYADAIAWAEANDIIEGYGNGKFGPEDMITREQMVAIMYRYAEYKGFGVNFDFNVDNYDDVDLISDYALPAVKWAVGNNLIVGDDGNIMPAEGTERCQVAAILMRFCEYALS